MKRKNLYVWFGEWALWRACKSTNEAKNAYRYWKRRLSWPLKIDV